MYGLWFSPWRGPLCRLTNPNRLKIRKRADFSYFGTEFIIS